MVKKAVLCGINNYKSQPDLRGCLNDVENMFRLLTEAGFQEEQIHRLTNEQVIKSNIQQEWQWLVADATPGDALVFHFSGHGSYIPDQQGDEIDQLDEITCLHNMDFYDPETFIRDDEWNEMLQQVPEGVVFTVIMDNCHSGTGTRAIAVDLQGDLKLMAVDRQTSTPSEPLEREDYQQLLFDPNTILPRYLEPPLEFQHQLIAAARSAPLQTAKLNPGAHLLLAACQDNQTAADAYIDGAFHGAFTYHLCKSLRHSPQISSTQLIDTVRTQLSERPFFQDPQHEGDERPGPIFAEGRQTQITQPNPVQPISAQPISAQPISAQPNPAQLNLNMDERLMTTTSNLTPENQRLLIEAYLKLLDTLAGASEQPRIAASESRAANRHLVCVHGISNHPEGYSDPWWRSLAPHVGQVFGEGRLKQTRWEVLWSDLVNQSRALIESPEQAQLRREIEAVLEERQRQTMAASGTVQRDANRATAERGGDFAIDDFLVYMLDPAMRQRIIDRFTKVVAPLLDAGAQIDVISHSWGTVVAYEGLRELAKGRARPGRVANLFTVGSALSIGPVRRSLRSENQDGDRPASVSRWINIDAQGDLVGGMLADMFDVNQEFLNLEPTGCSRSWLGYNLGCAHGSYFVESNLKVNRDIFAAYILA
nr:MAG: caspase family protein [Leptolyngbya sp. IPPAS B-1204]